ncbi:MAG: BrnT family toxin [Alphaproteobacteria bacterium]|nr:BrnT family toxin [Alphaproteobacteria bacterium]
MTIRLGQSRPLAYIGAIEFEWNETKSRTCHTKRGFAYAVRVFLDPDRLIEPDDRFEYGEPRLRVLGRIEGLIFVVVYTPRGKRFRLISARKANQREVRRYEAGPRDTEA